ncbi:MAG: 4-(cytidine 5'-diphospho)-2-C-methyl-D-erythritol kinase [Verrucomicrobia bacterium]|nr:4-(cytidine 5'-diphospho)-2-C-methyl-D-erythritol kinase [Verrucomicrobiota bacterium]
MQRMEIQAPAKINLFLDILGKRPDGYHNIKSIVLPISVYDRIVLENHPDGIETVAARDIQLPGIPWTMTLCRPEDNLTTRAARLLKEVTGHPGGVRIVLEKSIPIGAGLGGGSSDAAAVLKGLNTLWETSLSQDRLISLGIRLGCDIPALIHGGSLCMEGVGEQLTPIRRHTQNPLWLLLVYPGLAVSTTDIYTRYKTGLTSTPPADKFHQVVSGLEQGVPAQVADGLYNALQATVFQKYPLLELIKNKLESAGALAVQLTGSGSTLYTLVQDADQGHALGRRLRKSIGCPAWTCVAQAI